MSFWYYQTISNRQKYIEFIKDIITFSQSLLTDSEDGYLYYRTHERLFCEATSAINLTRKDISIDCYKKVSWWKNIGEALKTFICSDSSEFKSEKIAEFDKKLASFKGKSDLEKIEFVSTLRNQRIKDTKSEYDLTDIEYHCVVRTGRNIKIYELPMVEIDLDNITMLKKRGNCKNIPFKDGINSYILDIAKSTLKMKFKFHDHYLMESFNIDNYLNLDQVIEIMNIPEVKKIMATKKRPYDIINSITIDEPYKIERLNHISQIKNWLKIQQTAKNSKEIIAGVDGITKENWQKIRPHLIKNKKDIEIIGKRAGMKYKYILIKPKTI